MSDPVYNLKVGNFDCMVFKAGGGPRPATAFLAEAPADELEAIVRAFNIDPAALPFSMNVMLVKTGDHTVLVDTGLPTSAINEKLAEHGVDASTVDTIIITHGHGDHVGGILNASGEFNYPNARYITWQSEWEHWTAPDRFAEGDTNPAGTTWRTLAANQDRVTLISGEGVQEADVLPGIHAIATPGHTVGHIALLLESNGEKLLHIADAAHQPFQMVCPQWSPGFDYDKSISPASRRLVFEHAAREGSLLAAYHFEFPGIGRVLENQGALTWKAVE